MEPILKSIKGGGEKGCIFCRILEEGREKASKNNVVAFMPGAYIVMNLYPYTNGHVMVVPRKHAGRLSDYSKAEVSRIFHSVREAEAALESCFQCEGINVGLNLGKVSGAGIEEHLHVHLVPRWQGDTSFMTVLGEVRVIPQHLKETYRILRKYFKSKSM